MTHVTRRTLLRGAAGTALGLAFAGPYRGFVAHAQRGFPRVAGYGDLVPVADENGGAFRLELPSGFKYRTFHPAGGDHRDGVVPGRHDGMACFPGPNGHTILVRNHEINGNRVSMTPTAIRLGAPATGGYDPKANGGTVNVEVDGQGIVHAAGSRSRAPR